MNTIDVIKIKNIQNFKFIYSYFKYLRFLNILFGFNCFGFSKKHIREHDIEFTISY